MQPEADVERKHADSIDTSNSTSTRLISIEEIILSCYEKIKLGSLPFEQKETIYTATKRCIKQIIREKRFAELIQFLHHINQLDMNNPTRIKIRGILYNHATRKFFTEKIINRRKFFPNQRALAVHDLTEQSLNEPITLKKRHPLETLCGHFYFCKAKNLLHHCSHLIGSVIHFKEGHPDRAQQLYEKAQKYYDDALTEAQKRMLPKFLMIKTTEAYINPDIIEDVYTLGVASYKVVTQLLDIAIQFNDYEAFQAYVMHHDNCMRNHILNLKIQGPNLQDVILCLRHMFKQIDYAIRAQLLHPGPGHALNGYVMHNFHMYIFKVKEAFQELDTLDRNRIENELTSLDRNTLINYLHTTTYEEIHNYHACIAAHAIKLLHTAKELKQLDAFEGLFKNAGFPNSRIFNTTLCFKDSNIELLYQCRFEYNLEHKFITLSGAPNLHPLPYKKAITLQPY